LEIQLIATFGELTPYERTEFAHAIRDNELVVSREFGANDSSGSYAVFAMVNPAFRAIREETNGTKRRSIYTGLREQFGLPATQSADAIEPELRKWERENPGPLAFEKVRGFFGATNVANGKLRRKTYVQLIPAVKEASTEFGDPRRSPVIVLLSNITKQTFENRKEIQDFITGAQQTFEKLTDPSGVPELRDISKHLTSIIQTFYSDTELLAGWGELQPIQVGYPIPEISVKHRNLDINIASVGHGLQRALVFTVVQYLAEQQSSNVDEESVNLNEYKEAHSDIIILIEEPEIYQHPIKQRVIYGALKRLTNSFSKSSGIRVQILFSTHSEKFIEMKDFDSARILRKKLSGDTYLTECKSYKLRDCCADLAKLLEPPRAPMADAAFAAKLHIFSREMSEGFFGETLILVEGVTDKAILEAAYITRQRDLSSEGKCIIAVGGKTVLDKPFLIFGKLGIPVYMIFDNDKDTNHGRSANILLEKLAGVAEPVAWPEGVFPRFTAFDGNLETYLQSILKEEFEKIMASISAEWGLPKKEILKTPAAMSSLFVEATARSHTFPLIDNIIDEVDKMAV
jgi:putative ATP-dependent endonuclease of OLD family